MKRLLTLLIALCFCAPAFATPTVTKIASCVAATCAFGAPYHLTTTAGSAINTMVLIAASVNNGNGGVGFTTACSDARSNTYTDGTGQQQILSAPGTAVEFCQSVVSTAVISGDLVTFNPAVDGAWNIAVYSITGAATTSPIDQIVGINAVGAGAETFTSGTLTPSQQPEIALMIGVFNGGTFSAYGNIIGVAATGLDNLGTGRILVTEWRELTATTAGTAAFTITGTSGDTEPLLFITIKEASAGGTVNNGHSTIL